jgi:hypothetical protein
VDGGPVARDGGGIDDAALVSHDLPADALAGQAFAATVVVRNSGTSTWTAAAGYRLGGVGDEDPFAPARVELPIPAVSPGDEVAFTFRMVAPLAAGSYSTDWRMLREHAHWFGEVAERSVAVRAVEGCSEPLPPPLARMKVVVHSDQGFKKVLDSTPLVYGREFCAAIGYTDGRLFCMPRPHGHPETEACAEYVVGRASDTGRVGPTWTYNAQPCVESAEDGRCKNHYDNQFLVFVFGSGTARACSASGVCGEIVIP